MEKKKLYFNIYLENELENDIELVGSANTIGALCDYFKKNKSSLYSLGVKKVKNLRLELTIDNIKYMIIVDSED